MAAISWAEKARDLPRLVTIACPADTIGQEWLPAAVVRGRQVEIVRVPRVPFSSFLSDTVYYTNIYKAQNHMTVKLLGASLQAWW